MFAAAAGAHYPGVHIWSIWNEPNLYSWLGPQRSKGDSAVAVDLPQPLPGRPPGPERRRPPRRHLPARRADAARRDVPAQGAPARVPARDGLPRPPLPPDPRQRPPRSAAAARSGASRPPASPTTPTRRPTARTCPRASDDAAIGQLSRLRSTIDALARRGKLPRRTCRSGSPSSATRPSRPTAIHGASLQARRRLHGRERVDRFRNPRVTSYSQYTLLDDPPRPGSGPLRWSSWQAGLHFLDGRRKPYVYDAFRLPLLRAHAQREPRSRSSAARRTLTGGTAQIESKAPGASYRPLGIGPGQLDRLLPPRLQVNGAARRKYRVTLDGITRVKKPVPR